jgi:hypothetical protein
MAISDWEMAKKIKVHLDRELHETAKRAWLEETYARSGNYQIGPDVLERLENAKRQAELRNLREAQWGKPTPENINDIGIFTMDIDGVAALWKAKHSGRWVCEQDLRKNDDEDSAFMLTRLRSTGLLESLKTDTHTFWRAK